MSKLGVISIAFIAMFVAGCHQDEKLAEQKTLDAANVKFAENRKLIGYIEDKKVYDDYVKSGIARLKAEPDPGIKSQLGIIYVQLVQYKLMGAPQAREEVNQIKSGAGETAFYWDNILKKIG